MHGLAILSHLQSVKAPNKTLDKPQSNQNIPAIVQEDKAGFQYPKTDEFSGLKGLLRACFPCATQQNFRSKK